MGSIFRLQLLGEFTLMEGEENVRIINTHRLQSLLAYLVLHPNTPISRQRLAYIFWPDSSDAQARANLRNLIHQLHQTLHLADNLLSQDSHTVTWRSDAQLVVDVNEFKAAFESSQFSRAVDLYHGDLLPDCYMDWIIAKRNLFQQMHISALEQLIQDMENAHQTRMVIDYTHRLLRTDPLHEANYQKLMLLYSQMGDRVGVVRTYGTFKAVLKRELNLEPDPETNQVYRRCLKAVSATILPEKEAPDTTLDALPNNLPVFLTRFIGRTKEISEIKRLVAAQRLVTLTGAGGVGKTRLALAVASELLDGFFQEVWHIDLAPLINPEQVMQAVLSTLGIPKKELSEPSEKMIVRFRENHILLVLDNCEHLIEFVRTSLQVYLQTVPSLHILATSRAPLGLSGEIAWRVPPLTAPVMDGWVGFESGGETTNFDLNSLRQFESVQMFVDRAAAVLPTFTLSSQNAHAVGLICQRLDGIPLALELAAARIKVLSAKQIIGHLEDALWLLASGNPSTLPYQQTMQATMDWSYSLLKPQEKVLFHRISVFAGGASYEAIKAVCSGVEIESEAVLDLLSGLVDKSLVNLGAASSDAPRFYLHEITRQYARQKLDEAGEASRIKNQHLNYFCRLAEALESDLTGRIPAGAIAMLLEERYNMAVALEWALHPDGDAVTGLRLAAALAGDWEVHGQQRQERRWLDQLLTAAGESAEAEVRAKALGAAGQAAFFQGDFPAALANLEKSLADARQAGNRTIVAAIISRLGLTLCQLQEYAHAEACFQESLAIYQELGNQGGILRTLSDMGFSALCQGDGARAQAYLEQSSGIGHFPNDEYLQARLQLILVNLARLQGDFAIAAKHNRQAMVILIPLKNTLGLFYVLNSFSFLEASKGEYRRAARLFGFRQYLGETMGMSLLPSEVVENARYEAQTRLALGEQAYVTELARGRAMSLDDAIAFVMQSTSN